MDDKTIGDYTRLITSQHRQKAKYIEMIKAVSGPMIDCFNFLNGLSQKHDIDAADDPYLMPLARWTGTPLIIPGAENLEYFGFIDQVNALTFGEIDDPAVGGYFRESGQTGKSGLMPTGEFLRRLIHAKILKNQSTGNIDETRAILALVLNHHQFTVTDNKNMSVTFKCNAPRFTNAEKVLVQLFFPLPSGVQLIIEG